jgi:4'-phosphopantetheinyl transferase
LRGGELHLWKWTLNDGAQDSQLDRRLLSSGEWRRAEAFANDRLRADFILNRAAKRRILGAYLGVAPRTIDFGYGPRGKPYIAHPACTLRFNLTHSGTLSLLAVTRDGEIGVDLEYVVERRRLENIAARMFGDARARHLESLSEPDRLRQFYVYWTWLEACVKARGGGLFHPASRQEQGLYHIGFVPHLGYQACLASSERHLHRWHWRALLYANSIVSHYR